MNKAVHGLTAFHDGFIMLRPGQSSGQINSIEIHDFGPDRDTVAPGGLLAS